MVKKTPQTDSRHIARPKGPQRAGPSKDNISNYWRIFENNVPTTIVWIQITGPHKELLALGRGLVEKDFLGEISYSIGILETPEQHIALEEGLENEDQEWISFDENIFYWISAYLGEKIQDLDEKIVRYDWVYVAEESKEKGK